jgi:hypothetical protein
MALTRFATLALIGWTVAASGQEAKNLAHYKIDVCVVTHDLSPVLWAQTRSAQTIAAKMFLPAGVAIEWHDGSHACSNKPENIIVELKQTAPADLPKGALARAFPYEGQHIQIFADRLTEYDRNPGASVIGHVMVHEITHILQGLSRHSETGIMKAQWSHVDHVKMRSTPLEFTPEDIQWIQSGLAQRGQSAPALISTLR